MDQEWRRFHLLLVFLTLWNHAIGYPSLNSQVNPRSLRYHKAFSPRGFKSLSGASMTKNIPLGVNSNVLPVKSPSSPPFSQFGSASGTYESVSQTQSSQTGSVSASLALPQNLRKSTLLNVQGSSSSNVQGMASQSAGGPGSYSQYDINFKDRTGAQAGGSSQLVSAQGSARLTGLSSQSHSTSSQYSPVSSAYPSLGSLSRPVSGPSSVKTSQFAFSSGSRGGSGQLATSQLSGLAQGVSSHPVGSYVQSQRSPSQLALGSPWYGSASTAAAQPTSSQYNPANAQSLSQSKIPQGWRPSAAMSQSMFSASVPAPSKFVSSVGRPSQSAAVSLYSSASMVSPQVASGQYSKTTDGALSLSSQTSQRLQSSIPSSSQGSWGSGAAFSQSRFSVPSASDPKNSLASGGRLGHSAPASLYSSDSIPSPQSVSSLHGQAAVSAHSLSQSQAPQRWHSSASLSSQGFQPSSSVVSQTRSPSQGAKFPSRFSLASGSGSSQLVSTQGASSYSGLVQSPISYAPGYSKPASSPFGVPSQFTSSQSHYASSSQNMAGGLVGASNYYPSAQRGDGSNIASLHPQFAAGKYAPAPSLDVKVPVNSHRSSSGSSMSSSLQSQTWQPTTSKRVYNKFPTSGAALDTLKGKAVLLQSSSRSSSVAGGTSRLLTQIGGSYTGSSQSLGSNGLYTPGSPAYAKLGASYLGVSSGQSSSSQSSPLSTTGAGAQPTSSGGYLSALGESVSSGGSSHLSQSASVKEVIAPMDTSMSVASQTAAVSSGIQTSGATAFQSGSSPSSSLSSLQILSSPVDSGTQSASGSSQMSPFGTMTQSSGSSFQAASGVSSASSQAQTLSESAGSGQSVESQGMSGGSTSVQSGSSNSSFSQSAPDSNPSQGYYGVKG